MSLEDDLLADLEQDLNESNEPVERENDANGDDAMVDDDRLVELDSAVNMVTEIERLLSNNSTDYDSMIAMNTIAVNIDVECQTLHKIIKRIYAVRFHELESIIQDPLEYATAVLSIGNKVKEISATNVNVKKSDSMAVFLAASDNNGEDLSAGDWEIVESACKLMTALYDGKKKLVDTVALHLETYSPNLSNFIGSHVAAQLLGHCGGLSNLCFSVSANLAAMGSKKFSGPTVDTQRHGYIYYSDLVQSLPEPLRKKAVRVVSGKLLLAARADLSKGSPDGSLGRDWRQQVVKHLDKLGDPPENKAPKALPIPEDKPSKKRGGRRVRKFKEQFMQTELQRARNRINFASNDNTYEDDIADDEDSIRLVTAGGGDNRFAGIAVDSRTRAKMSKAMQNRVRTANAASRNQSSDDFELIIKPSTSSLPVANGADAVNNSPGTSRYFAETLKRKREDEDYGSGKRHP